MDLLRVTKNSDIDFYSQIIYLSLFPLCTLFILIIFLLHQAKDKGQRWKRLFGGFEPEIFESLEEKEKKLLKKTVLNTFKNKKSSSSKEIFTMSRKQSQTSINSSASKKVSFNV